jgi:ABC-2 type transport system permease protein
VAVVAAILRAQWLSMRMGANRRGAILSLITGAVWYGIWTAVACAVYFVLAGAVPGQLRLWIPIGLLGVCVYWQAMPILSASMGSSLDLRKLRIYPAPHGKLFYVEVLLRLTTGVEMLMVLAAGTAALFRNPLTRGGYALAPVAIFVLFNLLLASGTRSLLERLLSRRRVREVLVFLLFMLWMVPRLLFLRGEGTGNLHAWDRAVADLFWPWTATGDAALGVRVAPALLYLSGWTCLAAWFGRNQFARSMRWDTMAAEATPVASRTSRARAAIDVLYRLPARIWRDPVAAVVEKELRSLARTPRYRMVFVMGFSFGLMVWLPLVMGARAEKHAALSNHFLTLVCVYALTLLGQVSYWNCFGFDRSAAQIYFLTPQPMRAVLVGKNIASLVYIYLETAILIAITSAFRLNFGGAAIAETVTVVGVCALYLLALGNVSSVQYPRGLNPTRVSQGGASSRFQALVFLLYPLALVPIGLAYLARYALDSTVAFYVALALAAGIGAMVYWIAMESAVTAATVRRERMIGDLTTGEGPLAAD